MPPPRGNILPRWPAERVPCAVLCSLPQQDNHTDCGLFMLRYIRKWAEAMPDFAALPKKRRKWNKMDTWPNLQFTANDIEVNTVHCDSNTDPKAKSSEHTRMLIGYIQSMGYEYLVKPDAWATFVADRHSRGLARRERAAFQA